MWWLWASWLRINHIIAYEQIKPWYLLTVPIGSEKYSETSPKKEFFFQYQMVMMFYLKLNSRIISFSKYLQAKRGFCKKTKIIQPTKIAVESFKIADKPVRFTKFLINLSGSNFAAIRTVFSFFEISKKSWRILQGLYWRSLQMTVAEHSNGKYFFMQVLQLIINFYDHQTLKKLYK